MASVNFLHFLIWLFKGKLPIISNQSLNKYKHVTKNKIWSLTDLKVKLVKANLVEKEWHGLEEVTCIRYGPAN